MKERKSKSNKSKSLGIALYFGLAVLFIILTSIVFKTFDLIKNSKYDGNHLVSIAIISNNNSQIISLSPKDDTIYRMNLNGISSLPEIKDYSIPIDASVSLNGQDPTTLSTKSEFLKFLLSPGIKKSLTFIDLIRLEMFSAGVGNDKLNEQSFSKFDSGDITHASENYFRNQEVVSERLNIQVTNSTETPGLGNKVAKYITNLGGIVVLVNTVEKEEEKSKIIYSKDSYTIRKLSKLFNIPLEKGDTGPLSDVIIMIGKDWGSK